MVNLTCLIATASLTLIASTAIAPRPASAQEPAAKSLQPKTTITSHPESAQKVTKPLSGAIALGTPVVATTAKPKLTPTFTLETPLQINGSRSIQPTLESENSKITLLQIQL